MLDAISQNEQITQNTFHRSIIVTCRLINKKKNWFVYLALMCAWSSMIVEKVGTASEREIKLHVFTICGRHT